MPDQPITDLYLGDDLRLVQWADEPAVILDGGATPHSEADIRAKLSLWARALRTLEQQHTT